MHFLLYQDPVGFPAVYPSSNHPEGKAGSVPWQTPIEEQAKVI